MPLVDGGSHEPSNLQTLCTPCHKRKTAEEAGMETYWSCDQQNGSSCRVAKKLGFRDRRGYRFYVY